MKAQTPSRSSTTRNRSLTGRPELAAAGRRPPTAGRPRSRGAPRRRARQPQRPGGGDPRVLLPERARGGVARVGERRLALLDHAGVDVGERGDREVDLAADLEQLRDVVPGRAAAGRSSIVRTLAVTSSPVVAVAAGGGADHAAVLVDDRDGDAVDLELAQVARPGAALALDAGGPGGQLVAGEGVVEALHALEVLDRRERRGEPAVDLLARRLGRHQRRVGGLDRLELAHQLVVLTVADQRLVAHVVGEGVPVEFLGQVAVPGARVVGDLGDVLPLGRRGDRGLVEFGVVLTAQRYPPGTTSNRVPPVVRHSGCRYFAASRTWAIAARA